MAVDAEEGRRRREDNMVEIRKNKREENLLKKRREGLLAQQQLSSSITSTSALDNKKVCFFLFHFNLFNFHAHAVFNYVSDFLFFLFLSEIIGLKSLS